MTAAKMATAQAALPLESRLGGFAYYDPNLNISGVTDANINGLNDRQSQANWAASLIVGIGHSSCVSAQRPNMGIV